MTSTDEALDEIHAAFDHLRAVVDARFIVIRSRLEHDLGTITGPVATVVQLTDPAHRWQVHSIVDDDWQLIAVACDLPERGRTFAQERADEDYQWRRYFGDDVPAEPPWINDPPMW